MVLLVNQQVLARPRGGHAELGRYGVECSGLRNAIVDDRSTG